MREKGREEERYYTKGRERRKEAKVNEERRKEEVARYRQELR